MSISLTVTNVEQNRSYLIVYCWFWGMPEIKQAEMQRCTLSLHIAVMSCLHRITFTIHNHHIPHCLCSAWLSNKKSLVFSRYLVPIHTLANYHSFIQMHRQACCRDQAWFRPQGVHSCTAMGFHPYTEVLVLVGSMQTGWRVCCCADLTPGCSHLWGLSSHSCIVSVLFPFRS